MEILATTIPLIWPGVYMAKVDMKDIYIYIYIYIYGTSFQSMNLIKNFLNLNIRKTFEIYMCTWWLYWRSKKILETAKTVFIIAIIAKEK